MVRTIEKENPWPRWCEKSMSKAVKNVTFESAGVQSVVYLVSALLTAPESYCGRHALEAFEDISLMK
jgi:hypothetical protein